MGGQLRCLGTPSHIKGKYGSGYQLEVLSQPEAHNRVMAFVRKKLSTQAVLLEHHAGQHLFQLPQFATGGGTDALTLGHIFAELYSNRDAVGIKEYTLTQPSLEQVFIRFAREQDEDVEPPAPVSNITVGSATVEGIS